MFVVFRVDASTVIGTGHVMRCLTLAEGLQRRGAAVRFVCRDWPGNMAEDLAARRIDVRRLPAPGPASEVSGSSLGASPVQDASDTREAIGDRDRRPDWLVVDHYAIDARWESVMRSATGNIMAIDDLADRVHDCDLLLDQNLRASGEARYAGKVPDGARVLLGPRYALLRDSFRLARPEARVRSGPVRRVLVFVGGADPGNVSGAVVEILATLERRYDAVDVVIGRQHPKRAEIENACRAHGFVCHVQTERMADLMARADLAIGAGGSASWERCCVGLPAVIVSVAANQTAVARALHDAGACWFLGEWETVTREALRSAIVRLSDSCDELASLSARAFDIVDGCGVERVVEAMAQLS